MQAGLEFGLFDTVVAVSVSLQEKVFQLRCARDILGQSSLLCEVGQITLAEIMQVGDGSGHDGQLDRVDHATTMTAK